VRELENILERAVALSEEGEITPGDLRLRPLLGADSGVDGPLVAGAGAGGGPLPDYLDKVEREAILGALAKTGFNRTAAAKLLGVTFRTLRYRMQRLGIRESGQDAQDG
jgi:two-component system response regulator PilR (NtrC family)